MINGEKKMRACSTAGGGVMFIADEIERVNKPVSYNDLVRDKPKAKKPAFSFSFFGKRKKAEKIVKKAA